MVLADIPINVGTNLQNTELSTLTNEDRYNFPNFVSIIIQFLLAGIAISSFIFLLWGALQWVMAGGDKEAVEKARKKITNAITGLLITFSIFAILSLIRVAFGVDLTGDIVLPSLIN